VGVYLFSIVLPLKTSAIDLFAFSLLLIQKKNFFFLNGLFGCQLERFYFSLSTQLLKSVNMYISFTFNFRLKLCLLGPGHCPHQSQPK
jgi:hypothetical protein